MSLYRNVVEEIVERGKGKEVQSHSSLNTWENCRNVSSEERLTLEEAAGLFEEAFRDMTDYPTPFFSSRVIEEMERAEEKES